MAGGAWKKKKTKLVIDQKPAIWCKYIAGSLDLDLPQVYLCHEFHSRKVVLIVTFLHSLDSI